MKKKALPLDELTEEEKKDLDEALKENVWLDWEDLKREIEKEIYGEKKKIEA